MKNEYPSEGREMDIASADKSVGTSRREREPGSVTPSTGNLNCRNSSRESVRKTFYLDGGTKLLTLTALPSEKYEFLL